MVQRHVASGGTGLDALTFTFICNLNVSSTATIPAPGSAGRWSLLFDGKGDSGTDSIAVTGAINGGTSTVIIVDCGWVEPLDVGATWMIVG